MGEGRYRQLPKRFLFGSLIRKKVRTRSLIMSGNGLQDVRACRPFLYESEDPPSQGELGYGEGRSETSLEILLMPDNQSATSGSILLTKEKASRDRSMRLRSSSGSMWETRLRRSALRNVRLVRARVQNDLTLRVADSPVRSAREAGYAIGIVLWIGMLSCVAIGVYRSTPSSLVWSESINEYRTGSSFRSALGLYFHHPPTGYTAMLLQRARSAPVPYQSSWCSDPRLR